jgi:Ser/Thr protein kinase RdoA (MazF antagonist)
MTSVLDASSGDTLTTAAAQTPLPDVSAAVEVHFGLAAVEVSRLASERDELFLVDAADKGRFILRCSNPADDANVLEMQTQALLWIARTDPQLPVPRLVPDRRGRYQFALTLGDNPPRMVRLSTYLRGQPLPTAARSTSQRRALGVALARLGLALRDFSHPGADHELAWDIKSASLLHRLVPPGDSDIRRWDLVRRGLDRFEFAVKGRLGQLRAQVVHGDFNPHNILVEPRDLSVVTGILDFGDMVRTPLVADLAIACCYHTQDREPLAGIVDIAAGYHTIVPLEEAELDILYDLIVTRLCAAVAITEWRARRYPENSTYILKNTGIAWSGLHRLAGIEPRRAASVLRAACSIQ